MSCALCRLARTACNKEQPCGRCVRMGMAHHCFRPPSKRGRPPSRAPRPSGAEGPVPLLPLHPAGAVGPDHAGLVASASNTPHLVPTATLFAAGMGTPLPSGIIHPAGDYDPSLALSSTALSTSLETSTSTSSTTSTSSSTSTSALVLGSISEVKSELAEVKDELSAVHMMQMEMREMKRRLGQLEEDNASLKGTVIELRTQVGGGSGGGARFGQFRVDAAGGQQGPPLKKIRWMGHEALSPEMLWCFPFLEHINISRSNFVVDDLEKAILVLSFYPGKWTESTAFANQQFCNVSGFSLAELLERELVSVVAMTDKLRIVRGWIKGKLTGYGDIVHCSYYIEHKAGHLVKVAARIQFFFDTTTQINYSVWCIDEVLGSEMPSVPFKEVRAKEMAEWHEASRSITINGAVPSIQPAAVAAALAGGNGAAAATATSTTTTTTPLAHTPQQHTQHTPPQHPTPPSQPSPQQQQQQQIQHQQHHYPPLHHSHSPPFQQHHHHHHQQGQSQPQPQQHSPPYTQHHQHHQHQQHQHQQHQHQQHQHQQHSHQPRPSEPQAQHHSPTYQQHQAYPAQLQQGGGGGGGQSQSPPYTHAQHLQQQLQLQQQQQNQRHQPYQLYQQQQQQQLQLLLMQQDELDLLQQQQQQQQQQQHQQQHHQQLATPTTAEADEWREFLSISPSPSPGVFNYPGPPT